MELDSEYMGCISPIALRLGTKIQFVPCGKCNFCLQSRRCDWSFRLFQELKVAKSAHFLTLTYDEHEVPLCDSGQSLVKSDLQLFTKRLRRFNTSMLVDFDWPSLRYYSVGEYGGSTLRPHYHSIMFNLAQGSVNTLASIWGKGHVKIGGVSSASIHYVTKYVINQDWKFHPDDVRQRPFCLISNRSGGLGINYVKSKRNWHKGEELRNYVLKDGHALRVPRFYKDKIFSVREKEEIAKQSLLELSAAEQVELLELTKYHPDPYGYLYERLVHAYNSVGVDKGNVKLSIL